MTKPDYPMTITEFAAKFHDDSACLQYLIENRWPEGFICPRCDQTEGWWLEKYNRFECKKCHRQTSPLAGTLLHRSHVPIHLWFWAAYLVTTHTPGISALQLKRQLGISKIDTVWFMLHRLRRGMINTDRKPLSGLIEADETHIGGPAKGKVGRGVRSAKNKTLIAGAVEILSYTTKKNVIKKKAGRLRLQVLNDASADEIGAFIRAHVTKNSTIKSDGWSGYSASALAGYQHQKNVQHDPKKAHELAPQIHRIFSNLKAWLNGIHHGVEPKYLQFYLDEFVFKFNRRAYPMSSFRSLFEILLDKKPLTFQALTEEP